MYKMKDRIDKNAFFLQKKEKKLRFYELRRHFWTLDHKTKVA